MGSEALLTVLNTAQPPLSSTSSPPSRIVGVPVQTLAATLHGIQSIVLKLKLCAHLGGSSTCSLVPLLLRIRVKSLGV